MRRVRVAGAVAAILVGVSFAPPATAVPGELTPAGCIQDAGLGDCGPTQQGLDGATGVAVSPDGRSVYVVSGGDDAVVRFDRDPITGALTPAGCVQDVGKTDCGPTQQGLAGATGVAVSPDGTSVYVASVSDSAIVRFTRDISTGALTPAGCIKDESLAGCGATQEGLNGAFGVAVSPLGSSVYVTGGGDSAIVRFDRNTTTGALTPAGCIQDVGKTDCGVTQQGLDGAQGVAVSPDGRSLYVTGTNNDDAIVRFDRNTTTGALTPAGCIQDVGKATCGANQQGLAAPYNVAVSPDGRSVYVSGANDSAIVRFDRDPMTGALTPAGCIQDVGSMDCGTTQEGLALANDVAVSSDGVSVYVAGTGDAAVVRFDRDPATGALSPAGCIQDVGPSACGLAQQGLEGARGVAVTADERSVYLASDTDSAIVRFDREPSFPTTKITKGPRKKTVKRKAKFTFTSDEEGSTFECKLDKKPFKPCTSPKKVRVKPGRHRFHVRATDPGGNTDPTPAKRKWRVLED